jgi:hypothetical protein
MKKELKELVKKHFNLVDAPLVEETLSDEANVEETLVEEAMEETIEEIKMGEIKTADGSITLKFPGEELTIGSEIVVVTEDGDIPAPDGYHDLEGGITIKVEGGVLSELETTEAEEELEEEIEIEMSEESDLSIHEELIKALSNEFKSQMEALKLEFKNQLDEVKGKVESFSAEPATEKTITTKTNSKKVDLSYEPIDAKKKAQFERLVNLRNKN